MIEFVQNIPPESFPLVFLVLFCFSYLEHLFPPLPGDLVVVAGSFVVGSSTSGLMAAMAVTSIGSSLGFITMFHLGDKYGDRLLHLPIFKFIKESQLEKLKHWICHYSTWLIIFNRFVPAIRSPISFLLGQSTHKLKRILPLAVISATLWNIVLISLGLLLKKNIVLLNYYLTQYSNILLFVIVLAILSIFAYKKLRKNEN